MSELPSKKPRVFVSKNLNVQSWNDISKYFEDLLNRNLHSIEDLKLWLSDRSELDAVLEEDMAWRYIKMCIECYSKMNLRKKIDEIKNLANSAYEIFDLIGKKLEFNTY